MKQFESAHRFSPRRPLGRTGFVASILGIGDIADRRIALDVLVSTARRAIDAGLNVIDTAPGYEDGYSEQIVAQAVKGVRDRLFVIDKIDHFDRPVTTQIEQSLQRLQLDHVDAMVFHGLSSMEKWTALNRPGGGFDELDLCIKAGKARFKGISSHDPDVLRAALDKGNCDILMFAVGPYVHPRYIDEILPLAKQKGVGTVCFKTFGAGKLVGDTIGYQQPLQERPRGKVSSGGDSTTPQLPHLLPQECVHYTLTCDPDVALLGMSFPNEQDAAFSAVASFRSLLPQQMSDLRQRAKSAIAGKGNIWWNPGGV